MLLCIAIAAIPFFLLPLCYQFFVIIPMHEVRASRAVTTTPAATAATPAATANQ
jgi:hypothetical protein